MKVDFHVQRVLVRKYVDPIISIITSVVVVAMEVCIEVLLLAIPYIRINLFPMAMVEEVLHPPAEVVGDFDEEEISMALFLPDRVLWVMVAISSDEGMLINVIILYHY